MHNSMYLLGTTSVISAPEGLKLNSSPLRRGRFTTHFERFASVSHPNHHLQSNSCRCLIFTASYCPCMHPLLVPQACKNIFVLLPNGVARTTSPDLQLELNRGLCSLAMRPAFCGFLLVKEGLVASKELCMFSAGALFLCLVCVWWQCPNLVRLKTPHIATHTVSENSCIVGFQTPAQQRSSPAEQQC